MTQSTKFGAGFEQLIKEMAAKMADDSTSEALASSADSILEQMTKVFGLWSRSKEDPSLGALLSRYPEEKRAIILSYASPEASKALYDLADDLRQIRTIFPDDQGRSLLDLIIVYMFSLTQAFTAMNPGTIELDLTATKAEGAAEGRANFVIGLNAKKSAWRDEARNALSEYLETHTVSDQHPPSTLIAKSIKQIIKKNRNPALQTHQRPEPLISKSGLESVVKEELALRGIRARRELKAKT